MLKDFDMEQMISDAIDELSEKTFEQIQYETSLKWTARAAAYFRMSFDVEDVSMALGCYEYGCGCASKALEHAALVESGSFLENLANFLSYEKNRAYADMVGQEVEQEVSEENSGQSEEKKDEVQSEDRQAEVKTPDDEQGDAPEREDGQNQK